ncbi:MAG TPA: hypothetical protein VK427_05135 [Kofleriaceae bacterium]|nr:hypothetical protein [Kofleriaceae bacterium]
MTRFLLCVVLAVSACKKDPKPEASAPGSGAGSTGSAAVAADASAPPIDAASSGAAAGAARPPQVVELETAVAALLKEPEGDARSKKTCGMLMDIKKKARAVATNKPPAVDQAAWDAATTEIAGSLDGLGPYCTDDPPDDSVELPKLHQHIQALIALLPK